MIKNTKLKIAVAAIVVGTSGCASLNDSSLIYGNKTTVGIGVSKDASGNPIPDFNLGYESHNFAKVPVVVEVSGHSHVISGSSCQIAENSISDCLSKVRNSDLVISVDERSLAREFGISEEEVEKTISRVLSDPFLRNEDGTAVFTWTDSDGRMTSSVIDQLGSEFSTQGDLKADADGQPTALAGYSLEKVRAEIAQVLAATPTSQALRTDAYSVFGSFDVEAEESKANLGQIFATGVAAQAVSSGYQKQLEIGASQDQLMLESRVACVKMIEQMTGLSADQKTDLITNTCVIK